MTRDEIKQCSLKAVNEIARCSISTNSVALDIASERLILLIEMLLLEHDQRELASLRETTEGKA